MEKTTVNPSLVRAFPEESFVVSVTIDVPPDVMFAELTVIIELESERFAGMTLTVAPVLVNADPSTVAEIVIAVPEVVPVKLAPYVPFPLSVTAENVPRLVPDPPRVNKTTLPPKVKLFPAESFA